MEGGKTSTRLNKDILFYRLKQVRDYIKQHCPGSKLFIRDDNFDYAFLDGSCLAKYDAWMGNDKSINVCSFVRFRPVLSLDGDDIVIENDTRETILKRREDLPEITNHGIMPKIESCIWMIQAKRGDRSSYVPITSDDILSIEKQYRDNKSVILFTDNGREYQITKKVKADEQIFTQKAVKGVSANLDVRRVPVKLAKSIQITEEINQSLNKISINESCLIKAVIGTEINISNVDMLYNSGFYISDIYSRILHQEELIEKNYGNLTRIDLYTLLFKYECLESGKLVIKM